MKEEVAEPARGFIVELRPHVRVMLMRSTKEEIALKVNAKDVAIWRPRCVPART